MTSEIKMEPIKDGIWTSGKNDPTIWWCKVGDYIRDHFDTWTSKSIPSVGEPPRLLIDGYYYWQSDFFKNGKPIIRRQKKEDYEEAQHLKKENEEKQQIEAAAVRPNYQSQSQKPAWKKWNSDNDWYKIVDMKVVIDKDIPPLLQNGYTLLNKTDITKTSFWNTKLQEQQFVFVKREKISSNSE